MKLRRSAHLLLMALVLCATTFISAARAATGTEPYVSFKKQTTATDFAGSSLRGVEIVDLTDRVSLRLAPGGVLKGTDKKTYKVKDYWYGTLESPVFTAGKPFDTLIPSWNAITPAGTWIQVELRTLRPADNTPTKWYNLGIWASGTETIQRHSVTAQGDSDGYVATDTLYMRGAAVFTRYQYRLTLFTTDLRASPSVSLISVMASNSYLEADGLALESDREAWGVDLNVPLRSQMIYKKGGEVWCSPTSTSMVLAYWGFRESVPTAADATYDYVYEGNGNWPFNTAWAGSYGLEAYVTRMSSMAQVEEWISAGVPVL